MALNSENGNDMIMPVQPMYSNGYGGNGGNCWGGDATWLIILFLFAAMGGWGNGGFGGGFGGGGGNYAYPWMLANNTDGLVTGGFNQAATSAALGDIQNSLTTGFSNAEVAGCNRAMDAMQTAYNNQIAGMNQSFANQQALDARLGAMEMAQQSCCCENRAGLADVKYTIATEACADRAAVNDALRDVIAANTASTQKILDTMCQDKIDAKNEKIAELQNQLTMAELRANNNQQTQTLLTDNLAQTNALEQYLAPVPRPAYIVQNPNCCGQFNACGCGAY